MKRHLGMLAVAFVVGVAAAGTAAARDSFAISIGGPGFGVGYATGGYGHAYVTPAVVALPPVVNYGAAYPYYYAAPRVAYGPYVRYSGAYVRYRYGRRY